MRKQVFVNEEKRTAVVVLNNEANGILVRGKAVCHETDTFDAELGVNIANTRAWIKYYEALDKVCNEDLETISEISAYWTEIAADTARIKELAAKKLASIKEEYTKIIENI